jgi:integrase/recombinase XerD
MRALGDTPTPRGGEVAAHRDGKPVVFRLRHERWRPFVEVDVADGYGARVGLRAVEVARLRLDDLDWHAWQIIVDAKGHRRDQLPLPSDIGEAIVEHLRHRGHRRGERRVFLTVHAPIRPVEPSGVRTIVRDACRRVGIERVPAHGLRHALASDLLRVGASMLDIGQVLRHKHLESTAVYAKVDLQRLRLVASPWPGAL